MLNLVRANTDAHSGSSTDITAAYQAAKRHCEEEPHMLSMS